MGIFADAQGQPNSTVQGLIWPYFEHIRHFIAVLVTCKNKDDPIKNKGARVVTTLFIDFSDTQGKLTLKSVMEFLLKFKVVKFIIVLVTNKNKEDPSKN